MVEARLCRLGIIAFVDAFEERLTYLTERGTISNRSTRRQRERGLEGEAHNLSEQQTKVVLIPFAITTVEFE